MSHAPTIWEEGHSPGHRVVTLSVALVLTFAAIDLIGSVDLRWLFDIGFVLVCVAAALLVQPRDFFSIGVLPPLMMLGLFILLALTRPDSIARADDSAIQAVISGLGHHSIALGIGYALCLGVLAMRGRVLAQRGQDHGHGAYAHDDETSLSA